MDNNKTAKGPSLTRTPIEGIGKEGKNTKVDEWQIASEN